MIIFIHLQIHIWLNIEVNNCNTSKAAATFYMWNGKQRDDGMDQNKFLSRYGD